MLLTQLYVYPRRTLNSPKLQIRKSFSLKVFFASIRHTLAMALFIMYSLINTNEGRFSPFFPRLKEYNFSIGMVLGAGRRNSQYTD